VATNYPGSIDSLTNPSAGDALTSPSHSAQHANANDAIEAIETELGVNPSGSDATVAARLSAIEAGTNLATGAVTSAKIADGTIVNDDINASAAIARSKISGLPTSSTDNTVARFDSTAGAIQTSGVVIDDNNRLTVATGATGGYGFASGAVHLSGTGSPEGVVTATPGSTWLQTDATTDVKGWIRWIKATGTGNTGWQAGAEADTGTRNLNGVAWANGWAPWGANGQRLRRIGNVVDMEIDLTKASATNDTCYTLPSGFRPFSPSIGAVFTCQSANSAVPAEVVVVNGDINVIRSSISGDVMYMRLCFITSDAWPTSLPGSAA